MGGNDFMNKKLMADVALFAISQVAFFYGIKYVMSSMDPSNASKETAKKGTQVLSRLGIKDLKLSEHEAIIAAEVVHPDDIKVKFDDIGGLETIVDQLRESVIFPLTRPTLFSSAAGLFDAPKGVLLYGPPGCGKTMLAQALAKESGATFINVPISVLSSKWYGESNKLVAALFSLARKLQPSVIFIDEIDSLLRERQRTDHEISNTVKAEFMSSWDGLTTGEARIMVLGATNRPHDIDQAILRRMPKRFNIRQPDAVQRLKILQLLLKDLDLDPTFSFSSLVAKTDGMSGSELKETCRNAAMVPMREYIRAESARAPAGAGAGIGEKMETVQAKLRPLRASDFELGIGDVTGLRRSAGATRMEPLD